ncbi:MULTISPECIES: helix-turn-helix domain-containing protein [Asticcacaulis]|uniref:HxlR-like helix-turn-helix family protein n=1 Tax=Asticcacaulis biprosthecium C19 TaxID=715226 RepID=F4QI94_9CAUL|nr:MULTISPECIES: helix-turn-helix domain-containing protein [Asticcacaulis]EGF91732.1 hxlR-like helix-turn-helix family protein [Asticcacaulis biprosthecium C19]ESQ74248.1 HxlR family transcriptional regulator [Asticcacaulis sp. AC402]
MGFHQIPNVFDLNCPTRMVLDRLADKWAMLLLRRLMDGPTRFNQLHRDIQGISHKVLSQTLKKLERDGLISRQAFATVPVTVEYRVTPLGETLSGTVAQISQWAESNITEILQAQDAYDTRADIL